MTIVGPPYKGAIAEPRRHRPEVETQLWSDLLVVSGPLDGAIRKEPLNGGFGPQHPRPSSFKVLNSHPRPATLRS